MKIPLCFIGDVHGNLQPLAKIVSRSLEVAEHIVFLGDYVNRGINSGGVLDFLTKLQSAEPSRFTFLAGHHDALFLEALTSGEVDKFLLMGGAATLRNYPRTSSSGDILPLRERVPDSHVDFLRSLEDVFETHELHAAHMRPATKIHGTRFGIYGHHIQKSVTPLVTDNEALIDTGCGTLPNGRLTALFWPSLSWIQTS